MKPEAPVRSPHAPAPRCGSWGGPASRSSPRLPIPFLPLLSCRPVLPRGGRTPPPAGDPASPGAHV